MKDARQTAFEILLKIQTENAYSNIALDAALEACNHDAKDSALVSALVYGTIERLITIDYNLSLYLKKPVIKTNAVILTVLRLGVCQLLFMDRIPASAAVNESVKLIKLTQCAYAAGLINAVLRKVAGNGAQFPNAELNETLFLSVKYSFPEWLVRLWIHNYGLTDAVGIMEAFLRRPETVVRVNTTKTTSTELISKLSDDGIGAQMAEDAENAVIIEKTGAIDQLAAFRDGLFHVQDLSSQLCCEALGVKPNEMVFDMCSAPGGKAFTIAEILQGTGCVMSFDIYESRLELIRKGASRLNLPNISVALSDAGIYCEGLEQADKVLCDVPCSGLGIIRRKPEIRYKAAADIDKLPDLQYFILCNASRYVKTGGKILYSTCTLNSKENEDVCTRFLENHPNFETEKVLPRFSKRAADTDYLTLMPHINNTDGFFIALFCRTE